MNTKRIYNYAKWMAINNISTSAASIISTNSMLNSIITKPSYTDVVTTTYIGKDIIGQLAGVYYAWKTGKSADKQPYKYIVKGSIFQQVSFYAENASILITNSNFTLPFLGACNILKNLSFICMGAVNASNIQKLSANNIGEAYTRIATINTLASTLGMITGLAIVNFIPSYTIRTVVAMPILTVISVYSIHKAMFYAELRD